MSSNEEKVKSSKGQKRKLADAGLHAPAAVEEIPAGEAALAEASKLVAILRDEIEAVRGGAPIAEHRQQLRRAAHSLAELAKKEEHVDDVVEAGAVEAIVPLLTLRQELNASEATTSNGDDIEKEACFAVGLLAIKQSHQQRIADAGALPGLVALLKRAPNTSGTHNSTAGGVARRAADAITNLAHENVTIKTKVRTEGGIPPLVALLESHDSKVQRAAAGALRTLAFKNEDNKNRIVECGALPHLVYMVRDTDTNVHYEAVGVLGNLVHSSPAIKKKVLEEGALQPVIGLLSSPCTESQREAALLLGQFATTVDEQRVTPDYKTRIVQRGAVRPLILMLANDDAQLKEMAAFALGRLAQNADNQAGICQGGGLKPLLTLLESRNGSLQHNAAFALYGLADNEDNVAEIIKEGGVQRLMDGELIVQPSKDCVVKTLKRLEDRVTGRTLQYLLYLLRQGDRCLDKEVPRRVAVSLAHLCKEEDLKQIFLERGGLSILLDMLAMTKSTKEQMQYAHNATLLKERAERDAQAQREAARALTRLSEKAAGQSPLDCAPAAPDQKQVRLGKDYVNNKNVSDVTFVVEDQDFYAHRIALLASSDAFRAMFDGGYRERDAAKIEIPNIRFVVFEAMMQCVYTGDVTVTPDIAQELLQSADQYLLEGLKRLCETAIAEKLSVENLSNVYELSEAYHAPQLGNRCVLFALDKQAEVVAAHGQEFFTQLWQRTTMQQQLRSYMETILSRPPVVEPPKDA